jgi:hypothetical protein
VVPLALRDHPVATVEPRLYEPSPLTVISCPELLERLKEALVPLPKVKDKSLRFWDTSFGLAWRLIRVTVRLPAPVVKIASASTGRLPIVDPDGVTYVIVPA